MTRATWAALGLILVTSAPGCSGCGKPPPIDLPGETSGPLVFPPPDAAWRERSAIAVGERPPPSEDGLHVYAPQVDAQGTFEQEGNVVHIALDDDAFTTSDLTKAPLLEITPSVPGRTVWTSPGDVEFRADKPFDTDVVYAVALPELVGPSGKKLAGGFHASFKPKVEAYVAGKLIHHVPKPGEPRVVVVRPLAGGAFGPTEEAMVLYDQPLDLATAKTLVVATLGDGHLPLALRHPAPGDTWEGEKVDTRSIVFAKLGRSLGPTTEFTLEAHDLKGEGVAKRDLTIAPLPTLKKIACSYASECDVKGSVVRASASSALLLTFSNAIRHKDIERLVHVTPAPPHLSVSGWSEDIYVHADWAPATTYEIRAVGVSDRYGYRVPDVAVTLQTKPRTASAVLRQGVVILDEAAAKNFFVTTRNVARGELRVWPVAAGNDNLLAALGRANEGKAPDGDAKVITFLGSTKPHVYEPSAIDLDGKLEPGRAYLATTFISATTNGAEIAQPSAYGGEGRPSVPLLVVAGKDAIGAHAHAVGAQTLVEVYRLGSGEPVAGAEVTIGAAHAATDDRGTALVAAAPGEANPPSIAIKAGAEETILPFADRNVVNADSLFHELTTPDAGSTTAKIGFLITDRGIYRPGSTVDVKALVRVVGDKRTAPVRGARVRLVVSDAGGNSVFDEPAITNDHGFVEREIHLPKGGQTGPHRLVLQDDDEKSTVLAETTLRVSAFETPRFKVDIDGGAADPARYRAKIAAKYMFGAAVDGGDFSWSLHKHAGHIDGGALADAGLVFTPRDEEEDDWRDGDALDEHREERPLVGQGKLGADGTIDVDVALGAPPLQPMSLVFEADVTDSSYRHIAAKKTTILNSAPRYAGVRTDRHFGDVGPLHVELGVVNQAGKAVAGASVEARLEKVVYKNVTKRAESGATIDTWTAVATPEGTCGTTSDFGPRGCELTIPRGGYHRIVSRVDGHDGGVTGYYAWGGGDATPSSGKKIPIAADKKAYKPGDTAHVLVRSPFPEAIALLTVERDGILSHETRRFKGASTVFDIPLALAHAPQAYAVVTVLPLGVPDGVYRVGAVKLPVAMDDAKLVVKVSSDKQIYEPGANVEITMDVARRGAPVKDADVTLAVVDEGVLRLTDFHAKDPTRAFHPAKGLAFAATDTRAYLLRRKEAAHVAGGGGADDDAIDTRRDFVETAAWRPALVTDATRRVKLTIKLPDDMTEFRMMTTAIDDDGAAGVAESSFLVARPFLVEPAIPRFALRGDKLEIAAIAHNDTDQPKTATVTLLGQTKDVRIAAHGHERVALPWVADRTTKLAFAIAVDGTVRDKVERELRVSPPGNEEHPTLSGVFRASQDITLAVPDDAVFDDDARLVIRTGSALYPELGQRLSYLRDYPHGCVEQTTSGILPLLAARELVPWSGAAGLDDDEIKKRVVAGVQRLGTMRAWDGGLAYWPGGTAANVYGTTYAARALIRAKAIGIEEPGLLAGVLAYLEKQLKTEGDAGIVVSIAEVLAQAGKLPPPLADKLWDRLHDLDAYGLASLALALGSLDHQEDRVKQALDALEDGFDDKGTPKKAHGERDWYYWGSIDRDRAQAVLALTKLRPMSKLRVVLAQQLIRGLDRYSTQSAAWSLTAVTAFVGRTEPNGGVDVQLRAEGILFDRMRKLGGDNKEVGVLLRDLRGKKVLLRLEGKSDVPSAFAIEARWTRPDATSSRTAHREKEGTSVYRVYSDAKGAPVDLDKLKAGDVVRVALRVELPAQPAWRRQYLAITDRFPAGFEPVEPELESVAQMPTLDHSHPYYLGLSGSGLTASHVDLRDDRTHIYFDRFDDRVAYATYLLRATTPGEFALPAARAEQMYEPESQGYSDAGHVTIR